MKRGNTLPLRKNKTDPKTLERGEDLTLIPRPERFPGDGKKKLKKINLKTSPSLTRKRFRKGVIVTRHTLTPRHERTLRGPGEDPKKKRAASQELSPLLNPETDLFRRGPESYKGGKRTALNSYGGGGTSTTRGSGGL